MSMPLRTQAMILTLGNGVTRALGFVLRLIMARLMGAEALGVMEMSHAVGMLALTPVTAGIPSAMSRLTAKRPACDQPQVLRSGLRLVSRLSLALMPALLLLSPALSWLMGDGRTLPAILTTIPDILLLGLCSVYSGYCYGQDNTLTPALNECAEQGTRFVLCCILLFTLTGRSVAITAALPGLAEAFAGVVVILLFRKAVPLSPCRAKPSQALSRQLFRLAAPTTLSRLFQTGMRMLNTILLPVCLRRSGLSQAAATAQFGLLNGMAMPLIMLPGIVTGALCMVTTPAVSRQEAKPECLRQTMRRILLAAAGIGLAAGGGLFLLADVFSSWLYKQPALAPLLRLMAPMALLFAVHQVQYGMITGLGLQKKALTGAILSSAVSLLFTALLSPMPTLRLFGAAIAMGLGQMVNILWNSVLLLRAVRHSTEEKGAVA